MSVFAILHRQTTGEEIYVNLANVQVILPGGEGSRLIMARGQVIVTEKMSEIAEAIADVEYGRV